MKVTVITGSPRKRGTSALLAVGCGARSDIERSQFPQEAYRLGLSLK